MATLAEPYPTKEERGNHEYDDKDQENPPPSKYYVLAKGTSISGATNPPITITAIPFRPILHTQS